MRAVTGAEATFDATFFVMGNPVVLDAEPEVNFYREGGEIWESVNKELTDLGDGQWQLSILVPETAYLGTAELRWSGLHDGSPVDGSQLFEVVSGPITASEGESSLRKRLRDVLSDPDDDSSAFFTNDEIHTLLTINNYDVLAAAHDGWMMRAAHYQTFVDIEESGSSRRMSQMFKNAMAVAEFYGKQVAANKGTNDRARAGRVVGVVASLRGDPVDVLGIATMARIGTTSSYIRPFVARTRVGAW